ncbi:G-D-S-L family lipolytic protein [Echinicola marina]|uniref:SGNH/GDSL hydrolase family protein n=1 Tax=Echinicola marina TaxID=2859768 RepID=UPI001CF6C4EC|nr:SGNH/GDSL hydrolase family protein [Echinicola marina]UCS95587.1 G-D-S-L family lipolytic protein [Echinicola marina]
MTNPFYSSPKTLLFLLTILLSLQLQAQNSPEKFKEEVESIVQNTPIPNSAEPIYLFTGSSSIRKWTDIQEYFPDQTIVNTGFGGSQAHELLFYANQLIIRYQPQNIFIYEGDNDIASGKNPVTILNTMKKLVTKIHKSLPEAEIHFISPKPSPSRWELKEQYEALNRLMEIYCKKTDKVSFINIWDITLNENGKPMPEIFIEDMLHYNDKGYDLWYSVLKNYIPQ